MLHMELGARGRQPCKGANRHFREAYEPRGQCHGVFGHGAFSVTAFDMGRVYGLGRRASPMDDSTRVNQKACSAERGGSDYGTWLDKGWFVVQKTVNVHSSP